jgi:SAM-dependent methyltransferase
MDDLRSLARRLIATLPTPVGAGLRKAKRSALNIRSRERVFAKIADRNGWNGTESISGPGSTMDATARLRAVLPALLRKYGVRTFLDIPCGDAYWISRTFSESADNINYIGGDIVRKLIETNRLNSTHLGRFEVLDIVNDDLPKVDLVMVRDCLIHLPNKMVLLALSNIKRSGSDYILTTSYPGRSDNIDIEVGGFRPIDLQIHPFGLPPPLEVVPETEAVTSGKCMALWRVADL